MYGADLQPRPEQHNKTRSRTVNTLVLLCAFITSTFTYTTAASATHTNAVSALERSAELNRNIRDIYLDIAGQRSPTNQPDHGLPEEAFNYTLATATVTELENTIKESNLQIQQLAADTDLLRHELDFLMLNDSARAELLVESRDRARSMAVRAYIGIGAPVSSIALLNTTNANQMSYRNGLMRQQTEHLYNVSETYAQILQDLDEKQKHTSDEINATRRQMESLRTHISHAESSLEDARHWLYIADINRMADESFAKSGRVEPAGEEWRKLRFCESTERYAVDSGNTFYGAYQFTWETWGTVYGDGNPAHAPPEEQDARARLLYARRGSQPWPMCGRFLP